MDFFYYSAGKLFILLILVVFFRVHTFQCGLGHCARSSYVIKPFLEVVVLLPDVAFSLEVNAD